jgi:uncharacterized membrane protein YtjA (UPF0391 family)
LTGVIPAWLRQRRRRESVILFPRLRDFSRGYDAEPFGTFVPVQELVFQAKRDETCCAELKLHRESGVIVMLSWVVTFLIIALIAGILGFGGIAGVSIEIAKTIFFIAVVLFLISAVVGLARGRTRV